MQHVPRHGDRTVAGSGAGDRRDGNAGAEPLGADEEAAFLGSAARELDRVDLTDDDWTRVAELATTYADLRLGVIDAAVVAVAERLKVTTIATLNHRDFTVVRPAHCDAFVLVP